jgi:membrane-bound lytic murein transglycosylase D
MVRRLLAIVCAGTLSLVGSAWGATQEALPATAAPDIVPLGPLPPAAQGASPTSNTPAAAGSPAPGTPAPTAGSSAPAAPAPQTGSPTAATPAVASPAPAGPAPQTGSPTAATPASAVASPAASAPAPQPASAASAAPSAAPAADAATAAQASAAAQRAQSDLWERIRKGFAMPDLNGKKVANTTHWYAEKPDYIDRMAGRASLYEYYIVQEIEKRGLPTELALLPFVESAMQPQAVSSAQAAGLWQFMPSTGKIYSLEQNLWKDERLGVVESTRAALDYLEKLYAEFGSWHLALAAYNYGENGVEKALEFNRKKHRPLTYEALRLPRETQYYVPKLQAIKNIVLEPGRYGIELPAIRDVPYFVTVSGSRDIDVATAAQLADMPLEDFQALNPAFNRPLIVGAMAPTILLPADRSEKFSANLAAWEATGQPLASWTAYRLKSGETLAALAQRVGVTEASLRTANHVPPRYVAAAGSTILVPRDESMGEDVSNDMLDGSIALVPEKPGLRKITVRVRRGESLSSIARRWHVGEDEIVAWNNLHSPDLYAGQHLNLTVAAAAVSHKKKSTHASHSNNRNTAASPKATTDKQKNTTDTPKNPTDSQDATVARGSG